MMIDGVALPRNVFLSTDVMLQCVFDGAIIPGDLALIVEELLMIDDSI